MELLQILGLEQLGLQKGQEQSLWEAANTFFLFLKIPKTPLKSLSSKLLSHGTYISISVNPVGFYFLIVFFIN